MGYPHGRLERMVILEHDPSDPATTIVALLRTLGVAYDVRRLHVGEPLPELSGLVGIISMGGDMNTDESFEYPWLTEERRLIGTAVSADVPFLGICLGAQLLAEATGGRVFRRTKPELGWLPIELVREDPLFRGVVSPFFALEWHMDSFDPPADALLLARRPDGHQAFRVGRRAWGVQFHPETDEALLDEWITQAGSEPAGQELQSQVRRCRGEIISTSACLLDLLVRNFLTTSG